MNLIVGCIVLIFSRNFFSWFSVPVQISSMYLFDVGGVLGYQCGF